MKAQDLKNSILQLAIQGKLVGQREEEGTARELLKKIDAEKQALLKDGKIKKQKALPGITEDEIPFEIPESWEWVRLGEITHNWGQKKPDVTFDYIDVGSIDNIKGILSNNENLMNPEDAPSRARKIVNEGTVLYSTVRPYLLNICIVDKEFVHEPIASTAFAVLHPFNGINSYFLYFVLRSPMFSSYVSSVMKGVAYPAINDNSLLGGLLPLPPQAEQKRIVAIIEALMPYIDQYDVAYTEVEALNKKFPEELKKSILQYAIQGKLVMQRKEEGTAEVLYQQIQAEKQKLIKEGKIKKAKALPEITDDEIPFDIPESWKWVRLGEIVSILGDGIHGTPIYNEKGDYYFINGNNLNEGIIEIKDNTKKVDVEQFHKHKRELNKNTVLVSINGTIGNIAFYSGEKVILGKSACYFNLMIENLKYYLYLIIKTKYFTDYAIKRATGTTIKNVSLMAMKEFILPLPPLAEQKRIVAKIEALMPYIDKYEC
ncbi:restriction endonuclease subunit S [Acetobacterium wieringae]|uniref:EcoKI restriction-modification system protein HsdS n=1 Tax=Acetobacterium wieringae TaxID=52694 RepID=A0A1F2PL45_9FIRM|nr:restriction endonuclease subunit S [Acetobacterium wieringae]OFV71406.1 EcoKI restriction-modification system protein HsdS [Acetobacterium wieringae]